MIAGWSKRTNKTGWTTGFYVCLEKSEFLILQKSICVAFRKVHSTHWLLREGGKTRGQQHPLVHGNFCSIIFLTWLFTCIQKPLCFNLMSPTKNLASTL